MRDLDLRSPSIPYVKFRMELFYNCIKLTSDYMFACVSISLYMNTRSCNVAW